MVSWYVTHCVTGGQFSSSGKSNIRVESNQFPYSMKIDGRHTLTQAHQISHTVRQTHTEPDIERKTHTTKQTKTPPTDTHTFTHTHIHTDTHTYTNTHTHNCLPNNLVLIAH